MASELQKNMDETMKLMIAQGFVPAVSTLHYMQGFDLEHDHIKSKVKVNVMCEDMKNESTTIRFVPEIVSTFIIDSSEDIPQVKSLADYIIELCSFCEKLNATYSLTGSFQELSTAFANSRSLLRGDRNEG